MTTSRPTPENSATLKKIVRRYRRDVGSLSRPRPPEPSRRPRAIFRHLARHTVEYCQGPQPVQLLAPTNHPPHQPAWPAGQIGRRAGPFAPAAQCQGRAQESAAWPACCRPTGTWPNPAHRAEVAALWGVPDVPAKPGKSAVGTVPGHLGRARSRRSGSPAPTRPSHCGPDPGSTFKAPRPPDSSSSRKPSATPKPAPADLLLPATTWGEKDGTVTRLRTAPSPASGPPWPPRRSAPRLGDRAGFHARRLAPAWQAGLAERMFPTTPGRGLERAPGIHPGHDLDITGLSYALLESAGPSNGPSPEGARRARSGSTKTAYFPPAGRARALSPPNTGSPPNPPRRFPLHLNTGRLLRPVAQHEPATGLVARLYSHESEPCCTCTKDDMARRSLCRWRPQCGSRANAARGAEGARIPPPCVPGQCFVPMHWGGNTMGGLGVNVLLPVRLILTPGSLSSNAMCRWKNTLPASAGRHASQRCRHRRPAHPNPELMQLASARQLPPLPVCQPDPGRTDGRWSV